MAKHSPLPKRRVASEKKVLTNRLKDMNQIEKEKLRKRIALLAVAILLLTESAFALMFVLAPTGAAPSRLLMALLTLNPFFMSGVFLYGFATE